MNKQEKKEIRKAWAFKYNYEKYIYELEQNIRYFEIRNGKHEFGPLLIDKYRNLLIEFEVSKMEYREHCISEGIKPNI